MDLTDQLAHTLSFVSFPARLEGADFLELGHGSGGRGNLGKMHQVVYPQLAKENGHWIAASL
jgi:hypothetical protein